MRWRAQTQASGGVGEAVGPVWTAPIAVYLLRDPLLGTCNGSLS